MIIEYDKNRYFNEEIIPLLEQLQQKCNENHIPYFAAFGTKLDSKGKFVKPDGLRCMSLIPEVLSVETNDSTFAEFVNIINGAHTVYSINDEFDVDND